MATRNGSLPDPLLVLRHSISNNAEVPGQLVILKDGAEPEVTRDISLANNLEFTYPSTQSIPLSTPTRFVSKDAPVDLRSIYFAWLSKDVALPDYITEAQRRGLTNLAFVERLDLITWLEGASDESEHIRPLETDGAPKLGTGSAQIASGVTGGAAALPGAAARGARLDGIYKHERRLGDRNSILRGIKPTDFSHIKKTAELILRKERPKPGAPTNGATTAPSSLPSHLKKPNRRPDPIILLSPSASSLLRMSNVKSFLDAGVYAPPESTTGTAAANLLHIMRTLPSIDPNRPLRFILVEGPEQFKPDYWDRVVAVFTTGQAWQFKGYKWTEPSELFAHVIGLYVGWRGDPLPGSVKGWGRGVKAVELDKWSGSEQGRWRDREVVEKLWSEVEESMRRKGWGRDTGPS